MAFYGIRILKRLKASLPASLSAGEIAAFHQIAGKGFADPLIREEVRKFGQSSNTRVVFLTRDMVSALVANSEDLDAIYMAPKYPDTLYLENLGLGDIRELIIEIATHESKISLTWGDNEPLFIEGTWSGKNWYDYYKRRVRVLNHT